MKKILLILIALLIPMASWAQCMEEAPCPELARLGMGLGCGVPVAAGCTTEAQTNKGTADGNSSVFPYVKYYATRFQASSAFTVCKVGAFIWKSGTPTGTVVAYIYTDVTGSTPDPKPGTAVGSASTSINIADLGTSEPASPGVLFTDMSSALDSGSYYWLVLKSSAALDPNELRWSYDGAGYYYRSDDAITWTATTVNHYKYVLFSN